MPTGAEGLVVDLHNTETNAIDWPPADLGSSLHGNNALLTTKFPNKFAMVITFGCCSKVSHYGSFGLNTMTWCSAWNGGEKRSFRGLCVEALLEYAIIEWGKTLALISVLPIAKQNYINSFDKAILTLLSG